MLSGNSLRQTAHTHCTSVHQAAKLVAALLRVARVTAGLAESNGSLPPGRLPLHLRSVMEYGLPFLYFVQILISLCIFRKTRSKLLYRHVIIAVNIDGTGGIMFSSCLSVCVCISAYIHLIPLSPSTSLILTFCLHISRSSNRNLLARPSGITSTFSSRALSTWNSTGTHSFCRQAISQPSTTNHHFMAIIHVYLR